jgi:phage gpG-like protein
MQIRIEFQVKDLLNALNGIRQEIAEPERILRSLGMSLRNQNARRHAKGVSPDGSPWKPLSPLTIGSSVWKEQIRKSKSKNPYKTKAMSLSIAKKVRARRGGRILYESGEMLDSINYRIEGNTVIVGFNKRHQLAAWHHGGTKPYSIKPRDKKALSFAGIVAKRVNHPGIPARPLFGFPDEDRQLVQDVVKEGLEAVLSKYR